MMIVAGMIGGLGIICMIFKRTVLGLLTGIQLLVFGSSMMFVLAGSLSNRPIEGHVLGFFITLGGVGQLAVGYSLAVRLFFLKKGISLEELRTLKQ